LLVSAQPKGQSKKYPSLLWEITGKGLSRPSYLFGTMHVSSKLAFHLADSFFLGIRNADVVALETNPETWQEDMHKYGLPSPGYRNQGYYQEIPNDFLTQNSLRFYPYAAKIARALYSSPSTINNLLYRSWGNESSDFEEDTYLDMYIYQCGKKWGKQVAGVEDYAESMQLVVEAYKDAARDRNTRERNYDHDNSYSYNKLQEAYRSGNLDWLDSINKHNSFSPAFDEKFLYKRNEIQANSIDSIIKTGKSLFAGVGAAHLPGERGVIEMLRNAGYKLRPIKMGARDSQHKNQVEKVRVSVKFTTQKSEDGFFKVDIPGKLYRFEQTGWLDQQQFADVANGSYYMVTRIPTHAGLFGHSEARVMEIVDSLLYENIPGRIIARTKLVRNGFNGIDLTNRTRRGDVQRYNIFVTPFEVIIFKMSGNGEYVKNGTEASKFFGSIQFKEYRTPIANTWKKYSPPFGGFSVELPHEPYMNRADSWIFDATDKSEQSRYRVIRTDIHNYHFAGEDSFDLELLSESFGSSEFIDKLESGNKTIYKGYPALDCKYRMKDGSVCRTRFIIQGPHYYTLAAYGNKQDPSWDRFFQSFEIQPFRYETSRNMRDSMLYFSAKNSASLQDEEKKIRLVEGEYDASEDLPESFILEEGLYRSRVVENDSTGEKIHISFFKMPRYRHLKDSSKVDIDREFMFSDSSGIVRFKKSETLPNGTRVRESIVSDSGSSRAIWTKTYYRDGMAYTLHTQIDTLSNPGKFLTDFFESFNPADTLTGVNPFTKKTHLFFEDFRSRDSLTHERALRNLYSVRFDSTDLKPLKQLIQSIDWKEKKYLDVKKQLVGKLDNIKTSEVSDFLREVYYAAGDTVALQYKALETLLEQKTKYAFGQFRNIMENDPPVFESQSDNLNQILSIGREFRYFQETTVSSSSGFMSALHDSLQLAAGVLPGLLPLVNIDDYRDAVMDLLTELVDSGYIDKRAYDVYFSKFFVEARLELKKQLIGEKKKAIDIAERKKQEIERHDNVRISDGGNSRLGKYAILLIPYYDTNSAVRQWFNQVFTSDDRRLKYETFMLMLRKGKPYHDSLIVHYASSDDYRYELFNDLTEFKKLSLFPAKYRNHLDLVKSKLVSMNDYEKPDSLEFIKRLPAAVKDKKGYVYFFRYKMKKADAGWKLATAGLVPEDSLIAEFPDKYEEYDEISEYRKEGSTEFTELTQTRITDEIPLDELLNRELKRLLYSVRKSGRGFYNKSGWDSAGDMFSNIRID